MSKVTTYYTATDAKKFNINPVSIYYRQSNGTLKPDAKTASGGHLYRKTTLEAVSKKVQKRKRR
jgi:hypothetical protein